MIAIIKYNAGNVRSVENAVSRLGYQCLITNDPDEIQNAEKVIFPGVGEASSAMQYLTERNLDQLIKSLKQPTLGICLGQQLMCSYSEEGNTACLGIFEEQVKLFPPEDKVPHIGWNNLTTTSGKILKNIGLTQDLYFVHSYYTELGKNVAAQSDYILPFAAALQKDNFYAVQFHPEKSAKVGELILQNFLAL